MPDKIAMTTADTPAERYQQEMRRQAEKMVLLTNDCGQLFVPIILLPERFTHTDIERARSLADAELSNESRMWETVRTCEQMRAWAAQHLPHEWRVDFVRWRGDEM